jgi:excisionase family DNA binding protein
MGALSGQQKWRQMPDAPITIESLMTADEAARLLHVPRSTVYELVRSRGLPQVRIGERGLRFTRSDLGAGSPRTPWDATPPIIGVKPPRRMPATLAAPPA